MNRTTKWIAGSALGLVAYIAVIFGLLGGVIWFVVWMLRALGVSI